MTSRHRPDADQGVRDVRSEAGVQIVDLCKRFGTKQALDHVSLAVAPGETVALLGQNGAGKSTLLRILAGVLTPDDGSVVVDGLDAVSDARRLRKRAGLLLGEERSHYWRLSGRANLEFFAALHGQARRAAAANAAALLEDVGLADMADEPVGIWSTGMRIRLSVARALIGEPSLLLLDEPTRSLDPVTAERLREMLATVVKARGVTTVIATHDLMHPETLGARCVLLHEGRVAGSPVANDPASLREAFQTTFGETS